MLLTGSDILLLVTVPARAILRLHRTVVAVAKIANRQTLVRLFFQRLEAGKTFASVWCHASTLNTVRLTDRFTRMVSIVDGRNESRMTLALVSSFTIAVPALWRAGWHTMSGRVVLVTLVASAMVRFITNSMLVAIVAHGRTFSI